MADEEPKEEQPAAEEPAAEEPAKDDAADEPKADDAKEEPKEEPKEEASAEEPKKDDDKPAENDDNKEAPKEEPKKEDDKKEEKKEEPKKVAKVDKKKAAGKIGTSASCWKAISKAKKPPINWYITKPKKKSKGVLVVSKGKGGLNELRENLKGKAKEIRFALLRVESRDKAGSARAKFIYFKFIGTKANKMDRAQLVGKMSGIEEAFPVKHLTVDCDESVYSFNAKTLSREFLRVGGAHKPDEYDFGGGVVHKNK